MQSVGRFEYFPRKFGFYIIIWLSKLLIRKGRGLLEPENPRSPILFKIMYRIGIFYWKNRRSDRINHRFRNIR
jgi:hypothetical protein